MNRRLLLATLGLALATIPVRGDDPAPAARPTYRSVSELKTAHDRALMRELGEYLRANPRAEDRDQAYMTLFDTAIEHDWFLDTEETARRYLAENKEGAVRPLAQIVATMARAHAGKFGEALATFQELMAGLDRPDQEEFASNFADNLATAAISAGEFAIARRAYEALLARFSERPETREKIKSELARLDRIGRPAPEFEVKDLDGKPLRLADLRGKFVLLDFWATWCAPCVAELPNVQSAYAKYRGKGFEVVAVSLDETVQPLADFVKARKLPWRQVHNATGGADLVEAFGVGNIPATFLLGPDGTILRLELRGPALEKALAALMR
jgi:peroxiredoxin